MKYCMDCRFFHGNLGPEDREFLLKLLRSYDAKIMLNSWLMLGQIKKSGGHGKVDSDKVKMVQVLRQSKRFCRKEYVDVYALEEACAFHKTANGH